MSIAVAARFAAEFVGHESKKYPITAILQQALLNPGPIEGGKTKTRSVRKRLSSSRVFQLAEVVDEKLCDDLIELIAPTLELHKGCTILDVNPGACVWSRKIHEFLQPKRHVLLEPSALFYEPFIKPLLEKPNSNYRFSPLSGADAKSYWNTYKQVLQDPDLVPARPAIKGNDAALRELDTSMLVIGNLGRIDLPHRINNRVHPSALVLHNLTWAALSNQIFHTTGLVRMLFWLPNDRLPDIQAVSNQWKNSLSTGLALGADIVQLAGCVPVETVADDRMPTRVVPPVLKQVMADQAAESIRQPRSSRDTLVPKLETMPVGPNPMTTTLTSFAQLRDATHKFVEVCRVQIPKSRPSPAAWLARQSAEREDVFVYPQTEAIISGMPWIAERLHHSPKRQFTLAVLLDLHMQHLHLEAELAALVEKISDGEEIAVTTQLITEAEETLEALTSEHLTEQNSSFANRLMFAVRSAYAKPSPVPRDHRPFDPLRSETHEFFPENDLALIMLTPKKENLAIPGIVDAKEAAQIAQEFLKHLYILSTSPLPFALDQLGPNAAQDLLPHAPSIRDVRKGGRVNVMKVTPRQLSEEMVRELLVAFLEWPFRPTTIELMLAGDSTTNADENTDESLDEVKSMTES